MNQKQRLAKRARVYDQRDRASDHGPGRPPGPPGKVAARAPRATGSAAVLGQLRKRCPELRKLVLAGELTVCAAAIAAGFRRGRQSKPVVVSQIPPMGGIAIVITPLQEMELWLGPSHHGSAFAN